MLRTFDKLEIASEADDSAVSSSRAVSSANNSVSTGVVTASPRVRLSKKLDRACIRCLQRRSCACDVSADRLSKPSDI